MPGKYAVHQYRHGADVEDTLCQSSLNGRYTYLQQWDGRPAYADASIFLYYNSGLGHWYMSSTLGATSVNAFASSSASLAFEMASFASASSFAMVS